MFRTHYDNLKVARDAPPEVIRAAYKSLTQKYHPDRNPNDANAARIMQLVNDSYAVLSDPQRRLEHDRWIARMESQGHAKTDGFTPPHTQHHTETNNTATPTENVSAPPWRRMPWISLLRSRNVVLPLILLGVFLIATLNDNNSKLLEVQRRPGSKPYVSDLNAEAQAKAEAAFRDAFEDFGAKPQSSNVPMMASGTNPNWDSLSATPPRPAGSPAALNATPSDATSTYHRPPLAPNGKPWPKYSGYVAGYPRLQTGGPSSVTIDNGQNEHDFFVKLVSLNGPTAHPVREIYLAAHGKFTIHDVRAGTYDVRFRDLDTGALSRLESFNLEVTETATGIRYHEVTLTLYKILDGNEEIYPLSEDEF